MNLLAQQITNPILSPSAQGASGESFISGLISSAVTLIILAGGVIFVIVFLIGGVQWIASGGDQKAVEAARGKIIYSVIGLVLLMSTFAAIKLIESVLGISILNINLSGIYRF